MNKIKTLDTGIKKAFYGDKISGNMTLTPEGFLICHNVPIARTGTQDYLGEELGFSDGLDEVVKVIREDDEVFSKAAIASFEGKAVTNEHPDCDVDADNYAAYLKGHVTNVRRGEGGDSDKIIADLVIYDKALIHEIQQGKREVSCGYDCTYEKDDKGNIYQTNIRGNHVAVVERGRAGHKVRIKDKSLESEGRINFMKKKKSIISTILSFARDADPDEVAEVIETVSELEKNQDNEEETKEAEPAKDNELEAETKDSEILDRILDELKGLNERMGALESKDNEPSALEKLEDELSEEEGSSVPVEEIDEDTPATDEEPAEDEDTSSEESASDEDIPTTNNDSLIKLVRTMQPIVANIRDKTERKKASDSLAKIVRQLKGKPVRSKINGYKTIMDAKSNYAGQAKNNTKFDYDKQQETYDRLNPHKSKGAN